MEAYWFVVFHFVFVFFKPVSFYCFSRRSKGLTPLKQPSPPTLLDSRDRCTRLLHLRVSAGVYGNQQQKGGFVSLSFWQLMVLEGQKRYSRR